MYRSGQDIQSVAVVGLGALGLLFGGQLARAMPEGTVRAVADAERTARYRREGMYMDGARLPFHYLTPEETVTPADLVLVCVKFYQLAEVLPLIASQLGPDALIVSALNGISSEEVLAQAFGPQRVIYAVAQEMDARREGNTLIYRDAGKLVFGPVTASPEEALRMRALDEFFTSVGFPHATDPDMPRRLWGKWMLNVGINQTAALYGGKFSGVQVDGEARDTFKAAMREVLALAPHAGVNLTEADFDYWVQVMDALDPAAQPSLQQDLAAGRPTEVDLFAGTVVRLGERYGVPTPVNARLLKAIKELESRGGHS